MPYISLTATGQYPTTRFPLSAGSNSTLTTLDRPKIVAGTLAGVLGASTLQPQVDLSAPNSATPDWVNIGPVINAVGAFSFTTNGKALRFNYTNSGAGTAGNTPRLEFDVINDCEAL
jgi:hypothetical protein